MEAVIQTREEVGTWRVQERYLGVRLVLNMSPEGIHITCSPARLPSLLSTDTNPTHTDTLSM